MKSKYKKGDTVKVDYPDGESQAVLTSDVIVVSNYFEVNNGKKLVYLSRVYTTEDGWCSEDWIIEKIIK